MSARPKICVPLNQPARALPNYIRQAQRRADLIEVWCDTLFADKIKTIFSSATRPCIAVCRGRRERGAFCGSEKERIAKLILAVAAGARYVDCGIQTRSALIKILKRACTQYRAKLILSYHNWNSTPPLPSLIRRARTMRAAGAHIVKIATQVTSWEQNVILFELTKRLGAEGIRCIVVGMGGKGAVARIGCALLGGEFTYVALRPSMKTAQGQLTVDEWRGLF